MNFKSMLLIIAAVLLIVSPVMAKEMEKTSFHQNFNNLVSRDAESFEGDFPPAGWTIDTPSGHTDLATWHQRTESAFDGLACAAVEYDAALITQDCQFSFDAAIVAGEDHLSFLAAASHYWMVSDFQNYDLNVLVNGTQVFNMASEYAGPNWLYQEFIVDLTAYVGETVTLTFQYVGNDGAALYLDSVLVNDGTSQVVIPDAPVNNTCEGAIALEAGVTVLEGDLTLATNDFVTLGSDGCTGYNAAGNDVVYSLVLAADGIFEGAITGTHDGALYLVTDCADPANTCVAGADATFTGDEELLAYVNDTGVAQELFFVVDAYSGGGAFTGAVTISGTVATDVTNFDSIKAMYR